MTNQFLSRGGNWSTWQKTQPNPKSLATFSHALNRIPKGALVRDCEQSVAASETTRRSGQALSGERQRAVSGSALDHIAIRAGPQW